MTTLVPGKSSARNASIFFSTATRPSVMKIGRGKSRFCDSIRAKQIDIHASRPSPDILEATLGQFAGERRRRHHRHACAGMKPAQNSVDPACRNRRTCRDVFRKSRRVARRKRPAVSSAIAAYRKADRALGRDMDGIGLGFLDAIRDPPAARQCKPQTRIGWHRKRREAVRRKKIDSDTELRGSALQ